MVAPGIANSLPFLKVIALTCSLLLLSSLPMNFLEKNPATSRLTKWPFGPFALPSFSTVPLGYSVGLIDSAYSPLFHS